MVQEVGGSSPLSHPILFVGFPEFLEGRNSFWSQKVEIHFGHKLCSLFPLNVPREHLVVARDNGSGCQVVGRRPYPFRRRTCFQLAWLHFLVIIPSATPYSATDSDPCRAHLSRPALLPPRQSGEPIICPLRSAHSAAVWVSIDRAWMLTLCRLMTLCAENLFLRF